jgi:hypothetical protein
MPTKYMKAADVDAALEQHLRDFFEGHETESATWAEGPITKIQPRFRVLRFAPGPRLTLWAYCSIGAWEVGGEGVRKLEFTYLSAEQTPRMVELLAMLTFYHHNNKLDYGHTLPLGEPWVPGSTLDHLLISTPYPLGPEFENCNNGGAHAHFVWALPITSTERAFKAAHGLEALEQRFKAAQLEYWEPRRKSVL